MTITATRSGLVSVNDIQLWYEVHGSGKPLVLLHGGFGAVDMFGPNIAALAEQLTTMRHEGYGWTADAAKLPMPVLIVAGDAVGLPPRHAVEFFELLGGGRRDASWDRSGMSKHRLAILPGVTHYDINVHPLLATSVRSFLDEH